jgi:hypothetical protein
VTAIILLLSPIVGHSQVADTLVQSKASVKPVDNAHTRFGGVIVSNDSLLRWQQWSGFAEWASRQPGVVVRELGGYGRSAAIRTTTPAVNADRVRWKGVILNNPLTGQYNPAEIPFDQSAQVLHYSQGFSEFAIDPLVYDIVKPLTVVRYEQSSYEYRNLDGLLAMPVNDNIMVQASFQGQKDNGKYARSNYEGRRSTGSLRYAIRGPWTAEAFWLYQGAEMQESMGYQFDDPSQFEFDRFRAQAISGNSASMRRLFLTGLSLGRSGNNSRQTIVLYRKLHRHEWRTTDTTDVRALEWGVSAQNDLSIGNQLHTQVYLDGAVLSINFGDAMQLDSPPNAQYHIGYRAQYDIGPRLELGSHGELSSMITRKENFLDLYARFGFSKSNRLTIGRSIHQVDQRSDGSGLESRGYAPMLYAAGTDGTRWYARVNNLAGLWRYDLGIHSTRSVGMPLLNDRRIRDINVNDYVVASGQIERNGDRSEIIIGYIVSDLIRENVDQRIQISGYLKGYAFNRAAYIKGGAVFYASINEGLDRVYRPEFGMWILGGLQGTVPDHHRLDFEFAARVRSMILTGRLENALDGWTQKGYFQTLPYPMPGRRFRVGLKVHFRD